VSEDERTPRLFLQYWPLVWLASWLAPAGQRREWRGRRRAELWHWAAFLEDRQRHGLSSKKDLARYAWRSWPDALWLRYSREQTLQTLEARIRAPQTVLWACTALLVLVIAGSGLLPLTRAMLLPLPIPDVEHVGTVQYVGAWALRSGVLDSWLPAWEQQKQVVSGVAEFSFDWHAVGIGGATQRIVAAQVSPDFFDVLGVAPAEGRLLHASDSTACPQCIVVTYDYWRGPLRGDRSLIGKPVSFDGSPAILAGVLPRRFWFIAREVNAWAIAPPAPPLPVQASGLQMLVMDKQGRNYAVAPQPLHRPPRLVAIVLRLNPNVSVQQGEREMQSAIRPQLGNRANGHLEINLLDRQRHAMVYPYAVAMLAAVLIALLTAGRFTQPLRQFAKRRSALRWWSFFAAKSLLLLLAAGLLALELTPIFSKSLAHGMDPSAWGLAVWLCLALCMAALMWSAHDQRYRCPLCLARVSLPVLVGDHGRLLLGSGATEFVCAGGHSIMHVSDLPTSWIEAESWTHLDESWRPLFTPEEKED
jgi:hypothetical protein